MGSLHDKLEKSLIDLCYYGTARTGLGFGKYPLGLLDAIEKLTPLVESDSLQQALDRFKQKLDE